MSDLASFLPEVTESNFDLWQLRVDSTKEVEFRPHTSLWRINAMQYARRDDGVYAPNGLEFNFLVANDTRKGATDSVEKQLVAHGFASNSFAMCIKGSTLILS